LLVSANGRLINMVRSGVLDIGQASIIAFSLDDWQRGGDPRGRSERAI
jgi:hypothetical protein